MKIMCCCTDSRKDTFVAMYPLMRRMGPPFPTPHVGATHSRGKGWKAGAFASPVAELRLSFRPAGPRDGRAAPHAGRSTGVL